MIQDFPNIPRILKNCSFSNNIRNDSRFLSHIRIDLHFEFVISCMIPFIINNKRVIYSISKINKCSRRQKFGKVVVSERKNWKIVIGKRIGWTLVWSFSRELEGQSHLIESPFTEALA